MPSEPVEFPVLLFASLKDAAKAERVVVHLGDGATVADLLEACAMEHPVLAAWLPHVKVAVNCEYADANAAIRSTDEIALLPPVAGGCD